MIRKLLKKLMGDKISNENNTEKYQKINLITIIITTIAFGVLYFFLPAKIPALHEGDKQIYVPKLIGVFITPALLAIVDLILVLQKRVSKFNSIVLIGIAAYSFIEGLMMIGK